MKKIFIHLLCLSILPVFYACERSSVTPDNSSSDYFPLQVGNYWKVDDNDYLEITGTKSFGDVEFFEVTSKNSLGTGQLYLRIDENLNLVQTSSDRSYTRIIANLGFKKGQKLEDDLEDGTVIERNAEKLVFRYKCLLCSSGPNATYEIAFYKSKGFLSRNLFFGGYIFGNPAFKEIRINGTVYRM